MKVEKSVMNIFYSLKHIPFYHSYDLEEQGKGDGSCKRACFIGSSEINKNWKKASVKYGDIVKDLNWWPNTEAYPSYHNDDNNQSKKLAWDIDRKGSIWLIILNFMLTWGDLHESRIIIHYLMWNWVISLWLTDVNIAKEYFEAIDKLTMEVNYLQEQISIRIWISCSENGYKNEFSSLRRSN